MDSFDVIVVGGGHAGCEAAAAAARVGARVALVTPRPAIGVMSCNPAIGGLGKGHIVREIDALGGIMAEAADAAAIQYRLLNRRKGPAVQGPRVQADRKLYARAVTTAIFAQAGLTVVDACVSDLVVEQGRVAGVTLEDGGVCLSARAVVLATGTFLGGVMFVGASRTEGGRAGEASSVALSRRLRALGLPMGRLKTGTPPRLDGRTIDWTRVEWQSGDEQPSFFARSTERVLNPQLSCGITRTTTRTHDVIRANIHDSAVYSGRIEGNGPRYCPSIEDKVMRFGDREGHQIFLEPEGLDDPLIYPNGISTSLPVEVQQAFLETIAGLENVRIARPGYAIEYDYIDPRALTPALQLRDLPGLYCAGQINGTTGYEEAAGQGLVAGLNAARAALGDAPASFDRAESYIGVMIDDLVTHGVSEPYRMFTSRAEYRLHLRADNADQRLTPKAITLGLVDGERAAAFDMRMQQLARGRALLNATATPAALAKAGVAVRQDGVTRTAFEWLRFPEVDWPTATRLWPELAEIPDDIADQLFTDARYAVYLERQASDIAAFRADEALLLPETLDYASVGGLSNEMVERLRTARPTSIGAAARVAGVTPAALTALLRHVKRAA